MLSQFLESFFFVFSRLTRQLINGRCNVGLNANSLRKHSKSSVVNFLVTTPIIAAMASARLREYLIEMKSPMEHKIPGISKFPEKRQDPELGCPKFSKRSFRKLPFHLILY